MNGLPDVFTINEFMHENSINNGSEIIAAQSTGTTSIVVDKDPLKELKMMRRRLIQLTKRVSELETQNVQKNIERKVLLGIVSASTLLSVVLFVRTWLNR
ncbi:hypothetical protein niasHT_038111 [Heterodera trifolii]|uniref:Mff-like domain-containing protein n=1 Tax=Heterodera trifolii TaxID=157864 RepID=A0ABD2HPL7_9BILA